MPEHKLFSHPNSLNCSECGSNFRLIQINLTEAVYLCPNVKCASPFNNSSARLRLVERDFKIMDSEMESIHGMETESIMNAFSNEAQNDKDYLDNFLNDCSAMEMAEMTEDDIQAMDSVFELLQTYSAPN